MTLIKKLKQTPYQIFTKKKLFLQNTLKDNNPALKPTTFSLIKSATFLVLRCDDGADFFQPAHVVVYVHRGVATRGSRVQRRVDRQRGQVVVVVAHVENLLRKNMRV